MAIPRPNPDIGLEFMSPTPSSDAAAPRLFRLSEVTNRLRDILLPVTARKFWVRAQFVPDRNRAPGGHIYGQLVESDDFGKDVARLRVTIWKSDFERIEETLRARGQDRLEALRTGGEVCAECSVRYHSVFGLSLAVFDIDPDLGESKIDRNRRLILEGLQRDGLLERNRQLLVPGVALSIGLVTATNSAAYADFIKTLTMSGFAFSVLHVSAQMQGAGTAETVVEAVERLQRETLDVICVIRGGGSPVDLAWLDDDRIARTVANSLLPIWVGIGHEIDVGVLDHVAHSSHKTPTAVAEALVARLRDADARLTSSADRLLEATNRKIDLMASEGAVRENGLRQGVRKHLQIQNAKFAQRLSRLETLLAEQAERRASRFQEAVTTLQQRTRALFEQASTRLGDVVKGMADGFRRLDAARQEKLDRNRTGLSQGTRKHLVSAADRVGRRPQTFQAIVEKRTVRLSESLLARAARLRATMKNRSEAANQSLAWRSLRFTPSTCLRRHQQAAEGLEGRLRLLDAMSPKRLLARGYTITRTASGRIVRGIRDVSPGDEIRIELADGTLTSDVRKIEESTDG